MLCLRPSATVPLGALPFAEALRYGAEVFHSLRAVRREAGRASGVGTRRICADGITGNESTLEIVTGAIEQPGYRPGEQVGVALDPGATEFLKDGQYSLVRNGVTLPASQIIDTYERWVARKPIVSNEDGLTEHDWRDDTPVGPAATSK